MPRMAGIDGGTYFHHRTMREAPFAHHFDEVIYVRDVPFADLSAYDIVLVPSRLNAHQIAPLAEQLLDFCRGGGTLVAMGETDHEKWLPNTKVTPLETNFWWWLTPGADLGVRIAKPDHRLFDYIDRAAATWHLHGYFHLAGNEVSLIEESNGNCMLFEDATTYAPGRLVATTLDPCYHHGSHFMPATSRFLHGFLRWLKDGEPGFPPQRVTSS